MPNADDTNEKAKPVKKAQGGKAAGAAKNRGKAKPEGDEAAKAPAARKGGAPEADKPDSKYSSVLMRSGIYSEQDDEDDIEAPEEESAKDEAPKGRGKKESASDNAKPDQLRRADLVSLIASDTSVDAATIRTVIDSAMRAISDALHADKSLVLPPLGKLSVKATKQGGNGPVMTLRLSQPTPKDAK
ncbi:hypothetical protein BVG79_00992 [Ketogulonicigenium robustum]|uniref:DNA-binding protein n=1 Tax=Ketogulonicigenium robustum TaxID=92947 RepID=A0A1W6NYL5_9RHOB|nr:HU family DNA-binding protein [Ketogulonicigenium robustum]ARO14338.1 hypothetical protein BVG79_00992 [Ketogulonicigenium robustum]